MKQIWKLVIYGRVHGVGFRASVYEFVHREMLDVQGYVRNLPQGMVEVVVQGNPEDLQKVADYCYQGPPLARVENVEKMQLHHVENFDSFEISY